MKGAFAIIVGTRGIIKELENKFCFIKMFEINEKFHGIFKASKL